MNKENQKEQENEREDRTRGKTQSLGNCFIDHESSVEVGYGFYAIRSKVLIANGMC